MLVIARADGKVAPGLEPASADWAPGGSRRLGPGPTGLAGAFQLALTFTPEPTAIGNPPQAPAVVDPDLPSFTTALREQLGLRLKSTRAPVDVLVIDSVDRPTPD
jgi:uncharacterized protein (TIGR03435 family)